MIYFAQAIRERRTYTDFMIGLIMLAQYYNGKKTFYIKEEISDIFENNNFSFYNLEKNNAYKLLSNIRLKAVKDIKEDPMHRDDTYLKKLYIERITKDRNINDMYLNGYKTGNNFLLDNTVKFYYLSQHNTNDLHFNDCKKSVNDKSFKVKLKTLNKNSVLKKFTADRYFITFPTFRVNRDEDLKMLDIFCSYLINETKYKNLILISGSNDYKKYFYDKYGIETTHIYEDGFSSKKLGFRKTEAGFKCKDKGSLQSLLTDCFYIQDSPAGYIDFMQVYNTHRNELFKYGMNKYSNSYYDTFITRNKSQAIDIIGKELKRNKIFY